MICLFFRQFTVLDFQLDLCCTWHPVASE